MPDEQPFNRRNFFRQGFRELLRPLTQAAGPLEEVLKQLNSLDLDDAVARDRQAAEKAANASEQSASSIKPPSFSQIIATPIRPPGALPEQQFRETCSRCGECVRVCPVQCIKIDSTGVRGAGAPFIDIDSAACVMCDGLLCMNTCPSGALVPIPLGQIDMGTAIWNEHSCLRSTGGTCSICVDDCPIGEVAIVLDGPKIKVIEDGCTGCGICQNHCPTVPRSIIVKPRPPQAQAAQPRGRSR